MLSIATARIFGFAPFSFARPAFFSRRTRQKIPPPGKNCRVVMVTKTFLPRHRFSPMSRKQT
jgi:hypothetical protein